MRTLLALTALMLLLATAVWWKTRPSDAPDNLPPTTAEDSLRGVATLGVKQEVGQPRNRLTDAQFPQGDDRKTARPSDARGDHEGNPSGASHIPADPRTIHDLPKDPAPVVTPAPKPEPKPEPVAPKVRVSYTVEAGDNLYRIVVKHYGTGPSELVDAVAEANGIRDASALSVGQTLELPLVSGYPEPKRP